MGRHLLIIGKGTADGLYVLRILKDKMCQNGISLLTYLIYHFDRGMPWKELGYEKWSTLQNRI